MKSIIYAKELAKDVFLTGEALPNGRSRENKNDFVTDSFISQNRRETERELKPWKPDTEAPRSSRLESTFQISWNRSWDQFANKTLFGVESTFHEELYTTKLERRPQTKEREREALRLAREIEGESNKSVHSAEDLGRSDVELDSLDEESRCSSVLRQGDLAEDHTHNKVGDSNNTETFGSIAALASPSESNVSTPTAVDRPVQDSVSPQHTAGLHSPFPPVKPEKENVPPAMPEIKQETSSISSAKRPTPTKHTALTSSKTAGQNRNFRAIRYHTFSTLVACRALLDTGLIVHISEEEEEAVYSSRFGWLAVQDWDGKCFQGLLQPAYFYMIKKVRSCIMNEITELSGLTAEEFQGLVAHSGRWPLAVFTTMALEDLYDEGFATTTVEHYARVTGLYEDEANLYARSLLRLAEVRLFGGDLEWTARIEIYDLFGMNWEYSKARSMRNFFSHPYEVELAGSSKTFKYKEFTRSFVHQVVHHLHMKEPFWFPYPRAMDKALNLYLVQ